MAIQWSESLAATKLTHRSSDQNQTNRSKQSGDEFVGHTPLLATRHGRFQKNQTSTNSSASHHLGSIGGGCELVLFFLAQTIVMCFLFFVFAVQPQPNWLTMMISVLLDGNF
jgi:hypothetical protein